jgi:hypothetical protein
MKSGICKQPVNGFEAGYGSKSLTVVNTFLLRVALSHQYRLVENDYSVCILLVLEDPLGPDDVDVLVGWPFY